MTVGTQTPVRHFFVSYGMGAESTAWLHRVLTEPGARPAEILPDFSNLTVATAQTGDEWYTTGRLVERHILPLLRRHKIRFVEVARKGPLKADGVAVLQDSREPHRVHIDGFYRLSFENRESGTMPILSGHHACAQKAKGEPLDWWREQEFGDEPYFHMIGYNADEESRIKKDRGYAMGGRRTPVYPIHEWGWSRDDCVAYLKEALGIEWPKSNCRQCPFTVLSMWPEQLERFKEYPEEGAQHVVDEFVALALNPRSGLYGPGRSLISRLTTGGASEVVRLAADRMKAMPWALYRVRRRYNAPALAPRSVQKLLTGSLDGMRRSFADVSDYSGLPTSWKEAIKGAPVKAGDRDIHRRLWVKRRSEDSFPSLEEFHVIAPAQADDKALSTFEKNWEAVVTADHLARERQVGRAVKVVADLSGDRRRRDQYGVVLTEP